ncbi:MAG: sigma-70 family RNA polymerase sigma factor [Planctomycetota bacterium]
MTSDPQETCWTVLRAASRGDATAQSTFVRVYQPPVRDYLAHRWRQGALAEDVDDALQDVLVECIKPNGVLGGADPARGPFRGLLYGVARNVARRYEERAAQRGRRRPQESVHPDDLPAQEETLSRVFDRAWASSLLREAILQHASTARRGDRGARRRLRILRLRHQRGLAIREIAASLEEVDVDAVHNEYRRARRELAAVLREVVATRTGTPRNHVDAECRRLIDLLGSN